VYAEHAPPRDLGDIVACTWVARSEPAASGDAPIIADACSDIVVVGHEPPHVAGPATRTHFVTVAPSSLVVGIRFLPGAARAVFGCDATELLDEHADLHGVCGRAGSQLGDTLLAAPSTDAARAALEAWVRTRIDSTRRRDAEALHAARALLADRRQSVQSLGDSLGWSARRLHRELTATSGYGPKQLQRILRLQLVLRRARASRRSTLSSLALDAGYADQAHMTRDFRDITGFTPRELLTRSNADVGRWLDREPSPAPSPAS
jgi:AraC-like DNA-binding protein